MTLLDSMTIEEAFSEQFGAETFQRSNDGIQIEKRCPSCNCTKLSCNVERGLYHCWKCEFSGTLKTKGLVANIKKREIDYDLHVEILTKLYSHCKLDKDHKEYLIKRGIYNPERYGIKTIPWQPINLLKEFFTNKQLIDSGILYEDGSPCGAIQAKRILIPYIQDGRVLAIKCRVDAIDVKSSLRYLVPSGTRLASLLWEPPTTGRDLIFTEGEMKAMAACEAGFPTCAVSGLGCIKGSLGKLKSFFKENQFKRLFVILDSDEDYQNKYEIISQSVRVARFLDAHSTILFLPQDEFGSKMDLDTFLTTYSADYLQLLMESAWLGRETIKASWEAKMKLLYKMKESKALLRI